MVKLRPLNNGNLLLNANTTLKSDSGIWIFAGRTVSLNSDQLYLKSCDYQANLVVSNASMFHIADSNNRFTNITIWPGGEFYLYGYTINVSGNFVNEGNRFDAGTGTAGNDANPTNYEVDTGSLTLDGFAVNQIVGMSGFQTPFGTAPSDYTAQTVVGL